VQVADFDYHLPQELIAQVPAPQRSASRLLVLDRSSCHRHDSQFSDLHRWLRPGDLLVFNDSKVIPARIRGQKVGTSGQVEILLLEESAPLEWWTLLRPGKRVRPGSLLRLGPDSDFLDATLVAKNEEGHCLLRFAREPLPFADRHGELPLPPYIQRAAGPSSTEDSTRYQTVYARHPGSIAAPTAGLHFTRDHIQSLQALGIRTAHLTLHVGAGTFLPVKVDRIADHRMHEERFTLPQEAADAINQTRAAGNRIIAVGTTTARVLESVARGRSDPYWGDDSTDLYNPSKPVPVVEAGRTRIFLHPPKPFHLVNALLTNFHLPQSTLLMLVSAFAAPGETDAGRQLMLETYRHAIEARYRFFSYGDAMLIL
jgi:S-adenosylmethionine:tRNA ribosyltransferase-isomerase